MILHDLGQPQPVPLTARLTHEPNLENAAFDARIRAAFPLGTSAAEMAKTLIRQGFVESSNGAPDEKPTFMRWDGDDVACRYDAWVQWTANQKGALTAIRGGYFSTCL